MSHVSCEAVGEIAAAWGRAGMWLSSVVAGFSRNRNISQEQIVSGWKQVVVVAGGRLVLQSAAKRNERKWRQELTLVTFVHRQAEGL